MGDNSFEIVLLHMWSNKKVTRKGHSSTDRRQSRYHRITFGIHSIFQIPLLQFILRHVVSIF